MTTGTHQAELEKELFSACRAGNIDRVRRAIAAGVDPKKAVNKDMYTFPEETPLHSACRYVIIYSRGSGWCIDSLPHPHLTTAVKNYYSDYLDLYLNHNIALWPAPSSAAIEGRGLGDSVFEHSISSTLLLV